jgi:methionine sulfoxide reductase catalytic subunit
VRYCYFFNFLFLMMLIRSGLSILVDHPRLYFNNGYTSGTEWIRFTPLKVPRDRIWTAKDDARYIAPLVAAGSVKGNSCAKSRVQLSGWKKAL